MTMKNVPLLFGHYSEDDIGHAGDMLAEVCYGLSDRAGWWPQDLRQNPMAVPTKLMLTVSELGEAMEGHRKGEMSDKLNGRSSIAEELADAVIRIADLAGFLRIPLGEVIAEKLIYNQRRADHTQAARSAEGGKKY